MLGVDITSRPFFKKSESFHKPNSSYGDLARVHDHDGHVGLDGPVQVSYPIELSPSHEFWHRTLNSVGVEPNDAHLAGVNTGVWTSLVSADPQSGTRSYAATAYYRPNASRPNLVVLTGAEVREILLEKGEDKWVAKGARFVHDGEEYSVFASREVILSAGSVQSPQILELSGIGGSETLSAAGIAVKIDNSNVGENLQDHLSMLCHFWIPPVLRHGKADLIFAATTIVFEVDPSLKTPDDLNLEDAFAAAKSAYRQNKTGPFVVVPISMAYVPLSYITPQQTIDDLVSPVGGSLSDEREALLHRKYCADNISKNLGHVEYVFDLGNWGPDFVADPTKKYGSMLQILQYPFSKGSVHIRPSASSSDSSASLVSSLVVDPQYFGGRHGHLDLEIAALCHRFSEKICSTQPLAGIIREQVCPRPSEVESEEGLREWLKRVMVTDWHPVGTCAMGGKEGAKAGVVDERLRVYGVRGLRVVDASIMPMQISAHLQATVYAIAEKAAHMILEDLDGK